MLIAALVLLRKDQVTVPAVVGSDVATARAALERDGFEVDTVERTASQQSGQVIGQNPEGGTQADEGSTVVLTVSGGPGSAQVPSVTGLSEDDAREKLEDAGFEVRVRDEPSDNVKKGDAIGTEPGPGTPVDKGGTVVLLVSSGKEQVDVPNVVGETQADASRQLADAGFSVDVREQEDEDASPGTVLSQSPGRAARRARRARA